jgi:hypothetical protein
VPFVFELLFDEEVASILTVSIDWVGARANEIPSLQPLGKYYRFLCAITDPPRWPVVGCSMAHREGFTLALTVDRCSALARLRTQYANPLDGLIRKAEGA